MIGKAWAGLVLAVAGAAAMAQVQVTVEVNDGNVSVSDTTVHLGGGSAVVFVMSTDGYRFTGADSGGAFDCSPALAGRRLRCERAGSGTQPRVGLHLQIAASPGLPAPGPSPDLWIQND